jgi:glyoxylase-like metal-dependent hydrolase (beta-lactamase superfamily II)
MTSLASGIDFVDLDFLDRPGIIATAVLHSHAGVALIDPGPSSTLETLEAELATKGMSLRDVRHILLTHIHLDHAGCCGTLIRKCSSAEVVVHERGAPHMADPSRLLASAARLYGADMQRLWGDVEPVPAALIRVLKGGERLGIAGRELEVAYTPGHASHHVSFFDAGSGIAFVGDTAGIRRGKSNYVLPPTPPPDIDLDAWRASADRILAWRPDTLFLTHFGPSYGASAHFQQLFDTIKRWGERVRRLLADPALTDEQRQDRFVAEAVQDLRRVMGDAEASTYSWAARPDLSWLGLARYWRKFLAGTEGAGGPERR